MLHGQQAHGLMDEEALVLAQFVGACSFLGFAHYTAAYLASSRNYRHESRRICVLSSMIRALSDANSVCQAIRIYHKIQFLGLRPDSYSFLDALKAVIRLNSVELGRQMHCHAVQSGVVSNIHVATSLIGAYVTGGDVGGARKVFDEVPGKDIACWNAMIAGYVTVGQLGCALQLFDLMPHRNAITWTTVMAGYTHAGHPGEAVALFQRLQMEKEVELDEVAMMAALSACANLGALELGQRIHSHIDKHGLNKTMNLNNALIDMYAKSASISSALQVFDNMEDRSVITWTSMVSGLALNGLGMEALEMFSKMEQARVEPNEITFVAILSACGHVGLVELGWWYFNIMQSRHKICPGIQHYGCLVDLLGRAGHLQEAKQVVKQMPFMANAAIWGSLLAASNLHGELLLGECCVQHLIMLEPENAGNYALLCNMYASEGRWGKSRAIRNMMRRSGIRKLAGSSSIHVRRVHQFVSGDILHPCSLLIRHVLYQLCEQLRDPRNHNDKSYGFDEK